MRLIFLSLLAFVYLSFTGCSTNVAPQIQTPQPVNEKPTPQKEALFNTALAKVASQIPHDPHYRKLELDTQEKKSWFRDLSYRLWDRQITRYQFIQEGLALYPQNRYEFEFIANGFNQ
ncbi:MAG TPA: hypothetical protein ENN12_00015 [Epsilonproteobacteria bacterium]|nr:hypothetical protein [Campylobacterota bacterium]